MAEPTGNLDWVFIDTSELLPFTIMDVLLGLSEDLLFTWVWTDELLDEWEHVIVGHGQRSPASADLIRHWIDKQFPSLGGVAVAKRLTGWSSLGTGKTTPAAPPPPLLRRGIFG